MLIGLFMEYKGHRGSIEFSPKDKLYYGSIQNIKDLVNYHANSIIDLHDQYKAAIDDYIEFKKEVGI